MNTLKNKVALVGIGETKIGKLPGMGVAQLQAQAAKRAIEDAGLSKEDIDGVFLPPPYFALMMQPATRVIEYLGLTAKAGTHFSAGLDAGGASPCSLVMAAAAAINAGLCETALCVYGDTQATGPSGKGLSAIKLSRGTDEWELPYGIGTPGQDFALVAQHHMHEYGTTSEQLAAIAVTCRKHAALNPIAQRKEPLTIQDVVNSRMLAAPLHQLDFCLVSDGGGAVIVTSAERARDMRKRPVWLLGVGAGNTHKIISQAPNLSQHLAAKEAGRMAFQMAGLTPKDVDVAEVYDCFTIAVLVQLEALGFCKVGEGGPFVASGAIDLGGKLPLNTHGGLLSQGHVDGILHITEAVKQLRGEAGASQVKDAKVAVVTGNGGIMASSGVLILGRD
ncbi:MAG: thiolase family protein [Dehalococcoidia bacterium]|nr:thiolase family protein [Dehalococcoidia bacterium]